MKNDIIVQPDALIKLAQAARKKSYAPYSGFYVGAALLTASGKIFTGCNIENAAYSPTNCAERTAFFKAVSEGEHEFVAIAIAGGKSEDITEPCPPCGVCRQVMMEFCDPERFGVYISREDGLFDTHTLSELFPEGFGGFHLKK